MKEFSPFVKQIRHHIHSYQDNGASNRWKNSTLNFLDGKPAMNIQSLIPSDKLKSAGAFFTGKDLANFALRDFISTIEPTSVIYDPACGLGDLLLYCIQALPAVGSLEDTLVTWSEQILGNDIHAEFVETTKSRLILAAMMATSISDSIINPDVYFTNISPLSSLDSINHYSKATHIVINPPFTMTQSPDYCSWSSGKVNSAAIFLEKCVTLATSGTKILAILPDVLRSGTRYKKWRNIISSQAQIKRIDIYGRFSQSADIDVFVLELEVGKAGSNDFDWVISSSYSETIGSFFEIKIGTVVDFRDPHEGKWFPFYESKGLPSWETITSVDSKRRFNGKTFSTPLVVIRRNSRQGDKFRAIGTIINTPEQIAIENHLIVLLPKDGTLKKCKELLKILKNPKTNEWLDQRIRCRHLTISAVSSIPWWKNE